MEAIDDSGVAVVVHPDMTHPINTGNQRPEGVQQQSHSAAGLAVNGVHIVFQASARAQLGTALAGLLLLFDTGGHLGRVGRY